jgi:hypothetical protein
MSVMTNGRSRTVCPKALAPAPDCYERLDAFGHPSHSFDPQHNIIFLSIFLRINRYSSFFMKAPRHVGQSRTECESFG